MMNERAGNWRDLFLGFRMALDLRKMILAFAFITIATLIVVAFISFSGNVSPAWPHDRVPAGARNTAKALASQPFDLGSAYCLDILVSKKQKDHNLFGVAAAYGIGQWLRIPGAVKSLSKRVAETDRGRSLAGILIYAGLFIVLWALASFFLGGIFRVAVVEMASGQRMELSSALSCACRKFGSIFWAPAWVVMAIAFFTACIYVAGLIGRHLLLALIIMAGIIISAAIWRLIKKFTGSSIPGPIVFIALIIVLVLFARSLHSLPVWKDVGQILVALIYPMTLLSAFLVVILATGLFFGCSLMLPAVCAEGTDSFDAVSRAFSFFFLRPWRYFAYQIVACAYGILCIAFVIVLTYAFCKIATMTVINGLGATAGNDLPDLLALSSGAWTSTTVPAVQKLAAVLMLVPLTIIGGLMFGYVISYCATANTIIYFILRKSVDNTPMSEVYLPETETQDDSSESSDATPDSPLT